MTAGYSLLVWFVLALLLGTECLMGQFTATAWWAPAVGLVMAALVAATYMRLLRTGGLAMIFALAGVFWLAVMMGLGGLDPVTRHDVASPSHSP